MFMNFEMLVYILIPILGIALISLPLVPVFNGTIKGKPATHRFWFHIGGFFGVVLLSFLIPMVSIKPTFAVEGEIVDLMTGTLAQGLGFLSAALATGLSSLGAGIAVAAAAPAAIGAFSENEKNFGKSLIFVALGEGVAIYGLLISILIINSL
jgi:V/A-type H+-transporting ATPase subunit K